MIKVLFHFLMLIDRMYPSAEHMSQTGPSLPIAAANTGGSLPDLTNLHIPSPLQTPIDTDEQVNQVLSPTQPFPMSQRQSPIRRQPGNQQQMRKLQYTNQVPLMDPNLAPLENRLQQFQLYPQGNATNNDFSSHGNAPITTSTSPTLSPTSSSPLTPLFGSFPTSPMSSFNPEFYFKPQQQQQSQQPSTLALQQQLEQFSMHRPVAVGGMFNSSMQLPFQTLLAQTPTVPGQGMPSLAHFYGPGHSRVPDLIVTGIDDDGAKSDFAKDLSTAMAHIGGDDTGEMYSSDDPFQKVVLDPLDVEGFQMLSGQDSELTDAATEDQFRMDHLG